MVILIGLIFAFRLIAQASSSPSESFGADNIRLIDLNDDDYEEDDDSIPLVRAHHHHIGKRDFHHELFEPRNEIKLDYQLGEGGMIQTFEFTHNTALYVNLEALQALEILNSTHPICSAPNAENITTLNLDFDDFTSYTMAKQSWEGKDNILMVVEDDSCSERPGWRSVFQVNHIAFAKGIDRLSIQVEAERKRFGPHETETASSVIIHAGSLQGLKKREETQFYVFPRVRRGTDGIFKGIKDKVIPDKPPTFITSAIGSIQSKGAELVEDTMEDLTDVAKAGAKLGLDAAKKLEEKAAFEHDFNIRMNHNVINRTHSSNNTWLEDGKWGPAKHRKPVFESASKWVPKMPTFTFIDSYASMNLDVHFKFQTSIAEKLKKDIDELGGDEDGMLADFDNRARKKRDVTDYIQDAFVEIIALDDIDLRLQAEVVMPAGATIFCSLYLFPVPGAFDCVPLVNLGPLLVATKPPSTPEEPKPKSKPDTEKGKSEKAAENPFKLSDGSPSQKHEKAVDDRTDKKTHKYTESKFGKSSAEWNRKNSYRNVLGFGTKLACGIGVWGEFTVGADLNFTTPGMRFSLPAHSKAGWGIKDGNHYSDEFDGRVEWTMPKFHTQNMHADLALAFGPKLEFGFGAGAVAAEIYARIDMPKVVFKLATKLNTDEKCGDTGKFKDGAGLWITIKAGLFAGVGLPGGFQIDTTMIKIGGGEIPGIEGLGFSMDIFAMCFDITDTKVGDWETGKIAEQIEGKFEKTINGGNFNRVGRTKQSPGEYTDTSKWNPDWQKGKWDPTESAGSG